MSSNAIVLCREDLPGNLLLDCLSVGLSKQVQHGAAEVMGVAVWVAQLIGDGIQEEITPWEHRMMRIPHNNEERKLYACVRASYPQCPGPQPGSGRCPCGLSE